MVKIAISSVSPGGLDVLTDYRFGRCEVFTIVELEANEIKSVTTIKNPAINQSGGAGIFAAQTIANQGCDAVITGRLGPNAFDSLTRLNVKIYMAPIGDNIRKAIQSYINGELTQFNSANSPPKSGITISGTNKYIGRGYGKGSGSGMGRGRGR
jgi:predicted Fe-Mo cluster-binding NifX family protein